MPAFGDEAGQDPVQLLSQRPFGQQSVQLPSGLLS